MTAFLALKTVDKYHSRHLDTVVHAEIALNVDRIDEISEAPSKGWLQGQKYLTQAQLDLELHFDEQHVFYRINAGPVIETDIESGRNYPTSFYDEAKRKAYEARTITPTSLAAEIRKLEAGQAQTIECVCSDHDHDPDHAHPAPETEFATITAAKAFSMVRGAALLNADPAIKGADVFKLSQGDLESVGTIIQKLPSGPYSGTIHVLTIANGLSGHKVVLTKVGTTTKMEINAGATRLIYASDLQHSWAVTVEAIPAPA